MACTGSIADPSSEPPDFDFGKPAPRPEVADLPDNAAPRMAVRRLTTLQYDQSLMELLGDESRPGRAILPEDARTPFDNDYHAQHVSSGLIEGAELLAEEAAERLLADEARRDEIVGCQPTAVDDSTCLSSFTRHFGRKALRRALNDEEVTTLLNGDGAEFEGAIAIAVELDDFYEGVATVIRILLQDPEFLYRVETGVAVPEQPGVFALTDYEIATRMAFFIWNSIPDDRLLNLAESGELRVSEVRVREAKRMLSDTRAIDRWELFHAMWFGYEKLIPGGDLGLAMRAETRALFDKVFEDESAWQELFRKKETFVNTLLAENYDLDVPASGTGWVPYKSTKRQGLFSHGTFLSIGAKAGDTSPVQRGIAIQTRAFCRTIDPPPPEVDVDEPPESDALCKPERFSQHSTGGCKGCHEIIDPIGFGLEAFDSIGRFRTHEVDIPETESDESVCEISGDGELPGVGTFSGPGELSQLALESELLRGCFLKQVRRFVVGRGELDAKDSIAVQHLDAKLGAGDFTLSDVVAEVVAEHEFTLREQEAGMSEGEN